MRNGTCPGGEALMIFYVEDDPNIRELTIYALNQAGFEVEGFAEARALFHVCSSRVPDLILLEIMLPSGPSSSGRMCLRFLICAISRGC